MHITGFKNILADTSQHFGSQINRQPSLGIKHPQRSVRHKCTLINEIIKNLIGTNRPFTFCHYNITRQVYRANFSHPDLIALTHHAQDFVVFITTTGYALGKEQLEGLPGNVVLVFGVDGIGAAHDYYRGKPGAYTRLIQSLELTQDRPKEIIVTLWKGMLSQIDDIIALAEHYGVLLHFNAVIPVGRARSNRELFLSREENEMMYEKLQVLRQVRGAFLVTDLYKITEKDLGGINLFCKGRYSITPTGDVRPCEFHPGVLGNIFETSLSHIIEQAQESYF